MKTLKEFLDSKNMGKKPSGEYWIADMIERDFYSGPYKTYQEASRELKKVINKVDGLDIIYKDEKGNLWLLDTRGKQQRKF